MGTTPVHLCPRCGGALSAPTLSSTDRPRPVRWVAKPPPSPLPPSPLVRSSANPAVDLARPRKGRPDRAGAATPTPSYPFTPGWGLPPGPRPADRRWETEPVIEQWARRAPLLLLVTAALYTAAAAAELIRYLLLIHNRTHLIPMWAGILSDTLVWLTSPAAIASVLVAVPAAVCRLVVERAAVFDVVGRRDPRSSRTLVLGCLVPIVNWIYPGVFLTELDRSGAIPASHRFTAAVRWWWMLWLLGWAMLIGQVALRRVDGLQAAADAVLFAAITDLVAAAVAVATVVVFRRIRDEALTGGPRDLRRWVISVEGDAMVDKATPGAIAPVHAIDRSGDAGTETDRP